MALQLKHTSVTDRRDVVAFQSAGEATMAAAALVSYQLLCQHDSTGQRADDSALRDMLRTARRYLDATSRSYDRLVAHLKGRGFPV